MFRSQLFIILVFLFSFNSRIQASLQNDIESLSGTTPAIHHDMLLHHVAINLSTDDLKAFRLVCKAWLEIGSNISLNTAKLLKTERDLEEDLQLPDALSKIQYVKFSSSISTDLIEKYIKNSSSLKEAVALGSACFTPQLIQLSKAKGIQLRKTITNNKSIHIHRPHEFFLYPSNTPLRTHYLEFYYLMPY